MSNPGEKYYIAKINNQWDMGGGGSQIQIVLWINKIETNKYDTKSIIYVSD